MPRIGTPSVEDRLRRPRRAFVDDRLAGPPDRITALGAKSAQEGVGDVLVRVDFAIDVQLAQAARDQLGHLAAEVDDEKAVMVVMCSWRPGVGRGRAGARAALSGPRACRILAARVAPTDITAKRGPASAGLHVVFAPELTLSA